MTEPVKMCRRCRNNAYDELPSGELVCPYCGYWDDFDDRTMLEVEVTADG